MRHTKAHDMTAARFLAQHAAVGILAAMGVSVMALGRERHK